MTDQNTKPLIRRTTAMTDAFVAACQGVGLDVSNARLPQKREAAWTVTRRNQKNNRKRVRK